MLYIIKKISQSINLNQKYRLGYVYCIGEECGGQTQMVSNVALVMRLKNGVPPPPTVRKSK